MSVSESPSGETVTSPAHVENYFHGVAQARYTIRKIFRLVDEEAKRHGLDPLEHQALIQVYGSPGSMLHVNDIAERLDIPTALASKLVRSLREKSYVERRQSNSDRRLVEVQPTPEGMRLLNQINDQVHTHVEYFQRQLTRRDKQLALSILAFYVGESYEPVND